MGGSAADTPATPEYLRASDAERDHAINELRQEFVEGRLSHDTFVVRMQSALGARHRGQLTSLFIDLPPRRARPISPISPFSPFKPSEFLARMRAAFRRRDQDAADPSGDWSPAAAGARRSQGPQWHHGFQGPYAPRGYPGLQAAYGPPGGSPDGGGWPAAVPAPDPRDRRGSGGPARPAGSSAAAWGGSGEPGVPMPLVFPPGRGTHFTIGRTQECDLRIADMSVSRLHAQLTRTEDGWLLSDLGSHNGTRVNGWLVREPVPVRAGDVVQFGSATFVVQGEAVQKPQAGLAELTSPQDHGDSQEGSGGMGLPGIEGSPPSGGVWRDGSPQDQGDSPGGSAEMGPPGQEGSSHPRGV